MKKRVFALLLCLVVALTLLPMTATAADEPKTYTFTSTQTFRDEIRNNTYYKGDTIVFIPDEIEPFLSSDKGVCHMPTVGLSFCDLKTQGDVTGGICTVNEYSLDGSGCMVSFTITSDSPVKIEYKGAGPTGVETPHPDSDDNWYAYRYQHLIFTLLETGHSVSVLPSANGSITADRTSAKEGDTVTLTVTPDDGYILKQIQVLDGLGQDLCVEIGLTVTDNAFQMPDMKVKIQGIFEKTEADGTKNELAELDGTVQFGTPIPDDCVLDIRQAEGLPPSYIVKDGEEAILFEISVLRNNSLYTITDNEITITLILPEKLVGYDYYRVSHVNSENELAETQNAQVDGNQLRFTTSHLSGYLVEAGRNQTHTHSIGSEWKSDSMNHWHECPCGDKSDIAPHSFGEWAITKQATPDTNSSKERVCSVCNYRETADIEATGEESAGNAGKTVLLITLLLIAVAGASVVVICFSKKKRT